MITVTAKIGKYADTFCEDRFAAEVAAIRSANDPGAACKKAIQSAKAAYARFSGTPKMGLWYVGRIGVLEALSKEIAG